MIAKRYGKSAAGRIGGAAVAGALSNLVRKHPKTALAMTGAGLAEAGRSTLREIRDAATPSRDGQEDGER